MEIIVSTSQKEWDSWLMAAENPSFQQSWDWGSVLVAEGKTVERLAIVEAGKAVLLAQVTYQKLPFGQYAYAAAGPTVSSEFGVHSSEAIEVLAKYLKEKGSIFFRIEPHSTLRTKNYELRTVRSITPSTTIILDLRKPFEELLASMHKNTRYSIRQAESKGVVVKQEKNFDIFWSLMQKTSERNKLRLHAKGHYEVLLADKNCVQLTAYSGSTPIATAVFWRFPAQGGSASGGGGTFTYLFAASDYEYHELQAPYLLQKEAIVLAQKAGCTQYDFFGISPRARHPEEVSKSPLGRGGELVRAGVGLAADKSAALGSPQGRQTPPNLPLERGGGYDYDRNHKYAGITKFKLGFGGSVVERPGTFDVVLKSVQYRLYNVLRKLRRLI